MGAGFILYHFNYIFYISFIHSYCNLLSYLMLFGIIGGNFNGLVLVTYTYSLSPDLLNTPICHANILTI